MVGHGSRVELLDRRARRRERGRHLARARPERQLPGRREQRRTRRCFELAASRLRQPGEAHVDRIWVAEPEDARGPVRTAAACVRRSRAQGRRPRSDPATCTRSPARAVLRRRSPRPRLDLRHAPTLRRRRENQLMRLELVTLVVRDYDEALAYYTGVLGFVLVEDTRARPRDEALDRRAAAGILDRPAARASGQRPRAGPHRGSNRWTCRLLPVHRRPRSRPRTPACAGPCAFPWRTAC